MFIFHIKLRDIPLKEKLSAYIYGIPLDLSAAAYISILPVVYFAIRNFIGKKTINLTWVKVYTGILIVLFSLLATVNFNIYREWGSKINARVIELAITTPSESLASSASSPFLLIIFVFVVLATIGFYLSFVFVRPQFAVIGSSHKNRLAAVGILLLCTVIFIRGGVWGKPITKKTAYFSTHPIVNHASVNTEWNLIASLLESNSTHKNPYNYFEPAYAEVQVQKIFEVEKDTTIAVLKTPKPNVVLFLLESFTADLTKSLGNADGITPNIDSLAKQGILFSDIYAPGNRTDKGLLGSQTGFPTLGIGSLIKWPAKMKKVPAISQHLATNGYHTSFYYGANIVFDNYDTFILDHGFEKLVDRKNFAKEVQLSKWGVYDDKLFEKQLNDIGKEKQPFFSSILSLTNHEPFDLPGKHKFGKNNNVDRFKSTAFFTDSCIGKYISEAKKQPWFKNTLFIFIADHGHPLPKNNREIYEPQRYHIPLIFYGDVIKDEFRGKNFNKTGSQQDLAATLLAQLNINHDEFKWSKNLLNPYVKNFAFFSWDNGFGYRENKHTVTFDNAGKIVLYNDKPADTKASERLITVGKSYLQAAYQAFINL